MRSENLKQHMHGAAMVAAILVVGAVAQAQQPPGPPHPGGYWIGLAAGPVSEALQNQLNLPDGAGLVVEHVAPDGPAADAGIQRNDVLLKAGDKDLKNLRDLIEAVASSDGKSISLALIHGGEKKTVEVTPAKRNEATRPRPEEPPYGPPLADRLFRVLRPGLPIELEFPKDLKVTIHKEGDQPGQITVERGDKKWEVTDKTLSELPNEVRGYVEFYLGKMPSPPLPPEIEDQLSRALPLPPGVPPDVEQRLRREAGRLERRLGEEALPRVRDLQDRLRDVERRLEERLRDVEKRLEQQPPSEPAPKDGEKI